MKFKFFKRVANIYICNPSRLNDVFCDQTVKGKSYERHHQLMLRSYRQNRRSKPEVRYISTVTVGEGGSLTNKECRYNHPRRPRGS